MMERSPRAPGDELTHLAPALAAERAVERVLRIAVADLTHFRGPTRCESSQSPPPQDKPGASTILYSDCSSAARQARYRADQVTRESCFC